MSEVLGIAEARERLASAVRRLRDEPDAPPLLIGSHRRPTAALVRADQVGTGRMSSWPPGTRLAELRRKSALIGRLARLSRIESVAVFGSVARGEERANSDVDLLVIPEAGAGYFDLAQFAQDMETLLDTSVDVVSRRALDPISDAAILREAIEL
ncbi:MAG: nucleotidyltransferase domain-containing protein [Microbacteriaceae bacterium]|nr:nucleotidyltransferase domain-containing protein [Microbacteriaceae bacterium]